MTNTKATPKAYSYLRFSTREQMKGDSFRRQTKLAQDYCAENNLTLDDKLTFHDLAVSGFRGKNVATGRLGAFQRAVEDGLVPAGSFLLVESLDRVSRQSALKAVNILNDICAGGISVVTLVDKKVYTKQSLESDPMSLIMSILIFIRANEESVMKAHRVREAWIGKIEKFRTTGKKPTAQCPAWMKLDKAANRWVVLEDRADIVRRIFREAGDGKGILAITTGLNADHVPCFGKGRLWFPPYVRRLLDHHAVLGEYKPLKAEQTEDGKTIRKYVDNGAIPNFYPAIITQEEWDQAHLVRSGKSAPDRTRKYHNIFANLLRCGRCGGSVTRKHVVNKARGTSERRFVCNNARHGGDCKYTSVNYERFEAAFIASAPEFLTAPPGEDVAARENLEGLEGHLLDQEERRVSLAEGYAMTRDPDLLGKLTEVIATIGAAKKDIEALRVRLDVAADGSVDSRAADLLRLLGHTKRSPTGCGAKRGAKSVKRGAKRGAMSEPSASERMDHEAVRLAVRSLFSGIVIDWDTGTASASWRHGGHATFAFTFPKESKDKRAAAGAKKSRSKASAA